jgi:transmembrane sensor
MMMEKIDYKLLKNYSEGKYSLRDFKRVASWFEDISRRNEIESAIRQHWNEFRVSKDEPQKDLSAVYERIKQQILLDQPKVITLQKRIVRSYTRVAAILLLPLLIYTAYSLISHFTNEPVSAWAQIYSPPGARTQFRLPDGSKGWLNSNTKLKYPLNFRNNRHLELSGEAYFEVVHNKKAPFVVTTPYFDVKVLGTIFSVSAIEGESTTEVILEEGKVVAENPNIKLNVEMKPDQKLVFNNLQNKFSKIPVNAQQYNAWKDGLLVFRNEPLSEVFKRVGRWYNVKITIEDELINQYKYRATFRDEPIEEVIRLISLTVPINYQIGKREMGAQDVFAVKEITIKRK